MEVLPGTFLAAAMGEGAVLTNSYHHQAIREVAPGFTVSARAKDGIIEGIENADGSIVGVQWHPECMEERYPRFRGIFRAFVERAAAK